MDPNKVTYAQRVRHLATQLAQSLREAQALQETWDDRQYGPGAAHEITAEDLTNAYPPENPQPAADPNELYAFVIAASQIGKFIESDPAAVAGPYSATFNKLRSDM